MIWSKIKIPFFFLLTIVTTTIAGAEWYQGKFFFFDESGFVIGDWLNEQNVKRGLLYASVLLGILSTHEFGHYFMAKYYKVKVTLPLYIPMFLGITSSLGTMGAFIRIKDRITSRLQFFDIGYAGPWAGFVFALITLYYGFTHLPPLEYIFEIHPSYKQFGADYASHVYKESGGSLSIGNNLIFWFFENYVTNTPELVPHHNELMHYPILFAGYLSLFFTAMNLIPIGQLDGGHILFGLIGFKNFNKIMPFVFSALVFYGGLGTVTLMQSIDELMYSIPLYLIFLYFLFSGVFPDYLNRATYAVVIFALQFAVNYFFPKFEGYSGWLVWAFVLSRFLGVYHPPAADGHIPLDSKRKIIGWLSLVIFVLCFSPQPFIFND